MTDFLVWTRMQAEAGQPVEAILQRKEQERQNGNGVFFWGVGNPPSRRIPELVAACAPVDVVFSMMRSAPKITDAKPSGIVRWRNYRDASGLVLPVPEHALVTSKAMTDKGPKTRHYALICHSDAPLRPSVPPAPFDANAFRNANERKSRIGTTQVTALVERVEPDTCPQYTVHFQARLTGSYWVLLLDPEPFAGS